MPLRLAAWVAAVALGGTLTFLGALVLGFLSKQRVVDMFSSSRPTNYVRLFALVPVWALVSATLATALIEGTRWMATRRAARAARPRLDPSQPDAARPGPSHPDAARPASDPAVTVEPSAAGSDPQRSEAASSQPPAAPGQRTRIRPREPTS